jgi:hypothetical protein
LLAELWAANVISEEGSELKMSLMAVCSYELKKDSQIAPLF